MASAIERGGLAGLLVCAAVVLHGCGGGGSTTITTTTATTSTATRTMTTTTMTTATTITGTITSTTTQTDTTTTITFTFPVKSPCKAVEGENVHASADCVDYLNKHYMGYNVEDEESPVGLVIRGQPRYGQWLWCGGACYRGQPDCYVAGSLLNHNVMLRDGKYLHMPMSYQVGIVFQPKAIEEHLPRCSWQFDGAAFGHTNGGCGCTPSGAASCDNKNAAYYNVCPSTGEDNTWADCQCLKQLDCEHSGVVPYPQTCFWKGASFNSNATAGAEPNMTAATDNLWGIRQMLKQRMNNQELGNTSDGIPLKQYWNEITMDGKVMMKMLEWEADAAIAAFMYAKGNAAARSYANQFNERLFEEYGKRVPIVALDMQLDVTQGKGPFSEPEYFMSSFAQRIGAPEEVNPNGFFFG